MNTTKNLLLAGLLALSGTVVASETSVLNAVDQQKMINYSAKYNVNLNEQLKQSALDRAKDQKNAELELKNQKANAKRDLANVLADSKREMKKEREGLASTKKNLENKMASQGAIFNREQASLKSSFEHRLASMKADYERKIASQKRASGIELNGAQSENKQLLKNNAKLGAQVDKERTRADAADKRADKVYFSKNLKGWLVNGAMHVVGFVAHYLVLNKINRYN
jgi:hypothetical protein